MNGSGTFDRDWGERTEPLNTRLFPKHQGADKYQITGIAKRCDWVFLSDTQEPRVHLIKQTPPHQAPQTLFLSLRSPAIAIERFAVEVLPQLTRPFVLVSGSEDATIPRQVDLRWPSFGKALQDIVDDIRSHPLLLHWWAENLDTQGLDRLSPLPLGLVTTGDRASWFSPGFSSLGSRPLTALCAHRVRGGDQWALRKSVSAIAATHWASWAYRPGEEVPEQEFLNLLQRHSFVFCVEGGGLDPSPKAWLALLNGAVPIIRRNATTAAYSSLPVIYVDEWQPDALDRARLRAARTDIISRFQSGTDWRDRWLAPLTLDHWWSRICEPLKAGRSLVPDS
ncbi:hypothetical protein [Glycocaulis alkaliphilus]|uniref:hypothetical protein n=1 Tax=Glycocaulis alkaliphilus TaxID=1434191 RepID=UPI00166EBDF9|nr:hypothetical protein [Glycocaulis alkaliphilus]GGB71120.1 hypothetical protein GCM10007417_08630 [Glycocaulis alkaliphilus]